MDEEQKARIRATLERALDDAPDNERDDNTGLALAVALVFWAARGSTGWFDRAYEIGAMSPDGEDDERLGLAWQESTRQLLGWSSNEAYSLLEI